VRFLVDEGLSRRVALRLRELGHDAAHVLDRNLGGVLDATIHELAKDEGWVVLTADLDFGELALAPGSAPCVIFRMRHRRPDAVVARLLEVLASDPGVLQAGSVVISIDETRHRVRSNREEKR